MDREIEIVSYAGNENASKIYKRKSKIHKEYYIYYNSVLNIFFWKDKHELVHCSYYLLGVWEYNLHPSYVTKFSTNTALHL